MVRDMMSIKRRDIIKGLGAVAAGACCDLSGAGAKAAQPLIIMHNEDFPPFEYDENGTAAGILPKKINTILARSDEYIAIHRTNPWRRAQQIIRIGRADGLSAYPSLERLEYIGFNETPLETITLGLVFAKDHPKRAEIESISSLKDLKKFRVVDVFGNGWSKQKIAPIVDIEWVQSFDQVFEMLAKRRTDVHVVVSLKTAKWQFRHLGARIKDVTFMPRPDLSPPIPIHFGLRRTLAGYETILRRFDELYDENRSI